MTQEEDELYTLAVSDKSDPAVQIKILAYRVAVLTREKEEQGARISKMEKSFNMGAGVLLVLPVLGSGIGMMIAFGKYIFAPWIGH